jgi:hypothetical protein
VQRTIGSSDTKCPSSMLSMWCSCAFAIVAKLRSAAKAAPRAVGPISPIFPLFSYSVARLRWLRLVTLEGESSDGECFTVEEASGDGAATEGAVTWVDRRAGVFQ